MARRKPLKDCEFWQDATDAYERERLEMLGEEIDRETAQLAKELDRDLCRFRNRERLSPLMPFRYFTTGRFVGWTDPNVMGAHFATDKDFLKWLADTYGDEAAANAYDVLKKGKDTGYIYPEEIGLPLD